MLPASIAAGVFALCMVAGCGTPKPVLSICTWSDYIDPGVVQQFEKQYGCRVAIKTFDSNEEMCNCLIAGDSGFDIVVSATNHSMDQGTDGILDTVAYWRQNHPEITKEK